MYAKLALFVVAAVACPRPTADSQIESGTVVVIGLSKHKVVVAADSRDGGARGAYDDDSCKMTILNDKLFFIVSGLVAAGSKGNHFWDAPRDAKAVFREIGVVSSNDDINALGQNWAKYVAGEINIAMDTNPFEWAKYKDQDVFMKASFVGYAPNGEIHTSSWELYAIKQGARQSIRYDYMGANIGDDLEFYAFGDSSIVNEYKRAQTERSQSWKKELERKAKKYPAADRDVAKAVDLVQLSIDNSTSRLPENPDVPLLGGRVDALELETGKAIRWYQLKDSCKQNQDIKN
jgi:hypothetical protein